MSHPTLRHGLLLACSAAAMAASMPHARAQATSGQLASIEKQIQALQAELRGMKHQLAVKDAEVAQARRNGPAYAAPVMTAPSIPQGYVMVQGAPGTLPGTMTLAKLQAPAPALPPGVFKLRGVTVTLGGFIDNTVIYRTRNESSDLASTYTGIPFPISPNYHTPETRFSARSSRAAIDAVATPTPNSRLEAYGEIDFQAAAPTANSVGSNSYSPRIRHLYIQYDRSDLGLHVLAGQTWSLITMTRKGIDDLQTDYNIPLTLDTSYNAGFNYTRQPQIRISKDLLNKSLWFGLSLESPQTTYAVGSAGAAPGSTGTVTYYNGGSGTFFSGTNYSDEVAPDVIGKVAYDMPIAHLEGYGIARFLHDRVSLGGAGTNHTVVGSGVGAAALLHVVPKLLDAQASFLTGSGIGRYSAGSLPDATIGLNGAPKPLHETEALFGLVAHPTPLFDLFGYGGFEHSNGSSYKVVSKGVTTAYGYGNPLYSNAGCETELSTLSCVGNTKQITQGTAGFVWKVIHGKGYGSVSISGTYSYAQRRAFEGVGGRPKTDDNIFVLSVRYFPFQDTAPTAPPEY